MQVEKQPKFYVFFRCSAQLRQFLLAGTEDTERDTPAGCPFFVTMRDRLYNVQCQDP